jgi:hypothetical protein
MAALFRTLQAMLSRNCPGRLAPKIGMFGTSHSRPILTWRQRPIMGLMFDSRVVGQFEIGPRRHGTHLAVIITA